MIRFPNQVDDRPVIFALLQMIQGEFGQVTTTQPTPSKIERIARSRLPFYSLGIRKLPKCASLLGG
jgi:hypothetical protein